MSATRLADPIFIHRATEAVIAHLDHPNFSGNELASQLSLSREQTHRKLKQGTGMPTGKFISSLRLLKAYHMLVNTHHNVAEVGYKVGFESPAYFNKCFKETFGVSPGDVKKNGTVLQLQRKPIFAFYQLQPVREVLQSAGVVMDVPETPPSSQAKRTLRWRAAAIVIVGAIASAAYYYYTTTNAATQLRPAAGARIAVIPFTNQTGDSLLAPVGDIAGSWIADRLHGLGDIKTVPYFTTRQYLLYLGVLPDDPDRRPTFGEVVHADYLVTGSYSVERERLVLNSRLVDAHTQEVIYSMPLVSGSPDSVMQVLEVLRLKLAGLLANLDNIDRLSPPNYRAYVSYLKGLEELSSGLYPDSARVHFEHAARLEPGFIMPQLFLTWYYRGAKLDSVIRLMDRAVNVSRYEKSICEENHAVHDRDYDLSLHIALRMLQDYPQDAYFNLIAGHRAKSLFMPDLALNVLSTLQEPIHEDLGHLWYYYKVWNWSESLMMLGRHKDVIQYLKEVPPELGSHALPRLFIAAAARTNKPQLEIEDFITQSCHGDAEWSAEYFTTAAYEYTLASASAPATYFAGKAKTLMESLPGNGAYDFDLADVLYLSGDYNGTRIFLNKTLKQDPANIGNRIYLAYAEAAAGNGDAARRFFAAIKDDSLLYWRRHEYPYRADYLKARIYAIDGDGREAVRLLKQSLAAGQFRHHWDFERDVFLKNIFADSTFQAITKPRQHLHVTAVQ